MVRAGHEHDRRRTILGVVFFRMADLMMAKRGLAQFQSDCNMKKTYIGSSLDDFLQENRLLEAASGSGIACSTRAIRP